MHVSWIHQRPTHLSGVRLVEWGLSWAVSPTLLPTFGSPISGFVLLLGPYLSFTSIWESWGTLLHWQV